MVYDKWKPLKVMCGILIILVVIIALIGMLWWLPGNGKQWPTDLSTTLCLSMFSILLVLVLGKNKFKISAMHSAHIYWAPFYTQLQALLHKHLDL